MNRRELHDLRLRALVSAVEAVGGRVASVDGERFGFPVASIRVRDNAHGIELLNELARRDAFDPEIGEVAHLIRGSARTPLDSSQAVQSFVKASVPFIPERRETFQHPMYTLRYGGDCDDHARLVDALNRSLGIPAVCEPTFSPYDEMIRHVAPRAFVLGALRWTETTCDAAWDEHPRAAGLRLGLIREDILGAAS